MKKWPLYCANGWAWSAFLGTAGYRFFTFTWFITMSLMFLDMRGRFWVLISGYYPDLCHGFPFFPHINAAECEEYNGVTWYMQVMNNSMEQIPS